MALDFSLMNQRRTGAEPTPQTEKSPSKEYGNTPQGEKLTEALKRALNEEPEKAAFPDMDISQYCEEAQQQLRAMMILQAAIDRAKDATPEETLSQALRAVSILLQENYINLFIDALAQ